MRSVHSVERECVRDEGEKLAAETKVRVSRWGHDDEWVLAVVKKVIGVDSDELDEAWYTALEP